MMLNNYEKLADIGKGSFGRVSKVRRVSDGRILVWKELDYGKMNDKEKQQIVAEVNILRDLQHPNIVRFYDRCIDKRNLKIYIVMEYCEGGDLQQIIKRSLRTKEYIQEDMIWKIFAQIVSGLYFCHRRTQTTTINRGQQAQQPQDATPQKGPQRILHRDLKPGNIFLDANQNAKLGDFGLARVLNTGSMYAQTNVGTPYYMSPEQINEQKYDEKSDIWSLGCLTYEMAALRPPFKAQNQLALALKIKEGQYDRIPGHFSDELWRVIQTMLQQEQLSRASIDELVRHPKLQPLLDQNLVNQLQPFTHQRSSSTQNAQLLQQQEEKLRKKEAQLRQRENYMREKEGFLNQKEDELLERERQLNQQCEEKSSQLQEKEHLLNEILKRYELPLVSGDLKKALQTAVERTSQDSTQGSFYHNLKDSKQYNSDSFSPLKSGGSFLNSLNTQGLNAARVKDKCALTHQHLTLQSSGSPNQKTQIVHIQTQRGQQLLKNNKSDPNMRTLQSAASNMQQPSNPVQKQPCQTSVKKSVKTQLEPAGSSNYQQYAKGLLKPEKNVETKQAANLPDGASPMEILKRFKQQKRHTQKQQKVTLTTVDDETINEFDLPCDEENLADNTFRETTFNPKVPNPTKMISPGSQKNLLQMQRQTTINPTPTHRRYDSQTSLGTLSQFQQMHMQQERDSSAFNRTFDRTKIKQQPQTCRNNSASASTSLQALLAATLQSQSPPRAEARLPLATSIADKYKTFDARAKAPQAAAKQRQSSVSNQMQTLALQRQRSLPSQSKGTESTSQQQRHSLMNQTITAGSSLQALLNASGHSLSKAVGREAGPLKSARGPDNLPPKVKLHNVPKKTVKLNLNTTHQSGSSAFKRLL